MSASIQSVSSKFSSVRLPGPENSSVFWNRSVLLPYFLLYRHGKDLSALYQRHSKTVNKTWHVWALLKAVIFDFYSDAFSSVWYTDFAESRILLSASTRKWQCIRMYKQESPSICILWKGHMRRWVGCEGFFWLLLRGHRAFCKGIFQDCALCNLWHKVWTINPCPQPEKFFCPLNIHLHSLMLHCVSCRARGSVPDCAW